MSTAPVNLEIGSTIGDYEIVSVIGRGGMGKVYKVRNLISDRVEAMKVLLPEVDADPDLMARFLREIKLVASLEHPNIASLRTAMRAGSQILMIMEYVEGASLGQIVKQGRVGAACAVRLTQQVLDALGYAHRRGVVHRDVKPSNILVNPDERVKLTDFGIASRSGDTKLTASGSALGSLHYMSPEQMRAEPSDARSDLYSVGVTLYEMVTGKPPVEGKSFYAILRAHMHEKPLPAQAEVPELSPALSLILEKALEKSPEARFQTADEFRQALNGLESAAPPESIATTAIYQESLPAAFRAPELLIPPTPEVQHTPPPKPPGAPDTTSSIKVPVKMPSDTGSKSWDPAILENVRKNLAVYVGPMAKVLVTRAAKNARTFEELCRALAEEISSPRDREKFLRSQPM